MKKNSWILVANSSHAIIFSVEKNTQLHEVHVFDHPESRLHEQDLISSKPGRNFDSVGGGRHAYQAPTSAKTIEYNAFAKDISVYLDKAREENKFAKLYIGANPSFLGILRQVLSPQTLELIVQEIDRDLTHMKAEEIREHLPPVI